MVSISALSPVTALRRNLLVTVSGVTGSRGRLGRSVRMKEMPALAGAGWMRTLPAEPVKSPTPSSSAGFWMVR
jgi:hypothetical protein